MPSGTNSDYRGGVIAAAAPAPQPRGPIQMPESAAPPVPDTSNRLPEYPASARAAGVQAVVVARIVIDENGGVGRVEILRGHPQFDDPVRLALRSWRYRPARVEGQAIAVYQVVRIPFRLENL
jgi:protein TonB